VSQKKYWQARVVKKPLHSVVDSDKANINFMEQEKAVKAEKTKNRRRKGAHNENRESYC
jgi:hypothetical protein